MQIDSFINTLSQLSFENTFNPYRDICVDNDFDASPRIRRENLSLLLSSIHGNPTILWIGRDPGYRGARRTGLALTDEFHLDIANSKMKQGNFQKATRTPSMKERTATEIWRFIRYMGKIPLLWNVFPLHPHLPGDPYSNRAHTRPEQAAGKLFLKELIVQFRPTEIVAFGRDAYKTVNELGFGAHYVRHPSYGGQREFRSFLTKLYGLEDSFKPKL